MVAGLVSQWKVVGGLVAAFLARRHWGHGGEPSAKEAAKKATAAKQKSAEEIERTARALMAAYLAGPSAHAANATTAVALQEAVALAQVPGTIARAAARAAWESTVLAYAPRGASSSSSPHDTNNERSSSDDDDDDDDDTHDDPYKRLPACASFVALPGRRAERLAEAATVKFVRQLLRDHDFVSSASMPDAERRRRIAGLRRALEALGRTHNAIAPVFVRGALGVSGGVRVRQADVAGTMASATRANASATTKAAARYFWFDPVVGSGDDDRSPQQKNRSAATIVYLHGGGFVVGSATINGEMVARLAAAFGGLQGTRTLLVEYRRSPEAAFPEALVDALVGVRHVLDSTPATPDELILAGDSAGGTLALATLLVLRDVGIAPAGAILLSPLVDLVHSYASELGITDDVIGPVDDAAKRALRDMYLPDHLAGDASSSPGDGGQRRRRRRRRRLLRPPPLWGRLKTALLPLLGGLGLSSSPSVNNGTVDNTTFNASSTPSSTGGGGGFPWWSSPQATTPGASRTTGPPTTTASSSPGTREPPTTSTLAAATAHQKHVALVSPAAATKRQLASLGATAIRVHLGANEVLRDSVLRWAARAADAGVDVSVRVFDKEGHAFHAFGFAPGWAEARQDLGAFVGEALEKRRRANALKLEAQTKLRVRLGVLAAAVAALRTTGVVPGELVLATLGAAGLLRSGTSDDDEASVSSSEEPSAPRSPPSRTTTTTTKTPAWLDGGGVTPSSLAAAAAAWGPASRSRSGHRSAACLLASAGGGPSLQLGRRRRAGAPLSPSRVRHL